MNATTNLDVLLLRVFSSIYMNRSVSAAARELDMSQPGVSTALMRLRGQLQDPLFTRTTSGMEPTRRAREMIGPIRRILQTVDQELFAPPGPVGHRREHLSTSRHPQHPVHGAWHIASNCRAAAAPT